MEKTDQKIVELLERVGPQASDAALAAAQYQAITNILAGVLFLIAGIFLLKFCTKQYKKENKQFDEIKEIFMIGSGAFSLIAFTVSIVMLFDLISWIGIFDPRIFLANRILF